MYKNLISFTLDSCLGRWVSNFQSPLAVGNDFLYIFYFSILDDDDDNISARHVTHGLHQ